MYRFDLPSLQEDERLLVGNLDLEFGLGGNMSCICFGQVVGCFLGGDDKHTPFQVILGS